MSTCVSPMHLHFALPRGHNNYRSLSLNQTWKNSLAFILGKNRSRLYEQSDTLKTIWWLMMFPSFPGNTASLLTSQTSLWRRHTDVCDVIQTKIVVLASWPTFKAWFDVCDVTRLAVLPGKLGNVINLDNCRWQHICKQTSFFNGAKGPTVAPILHFCWNQMSIHCF